MLPLPIAGARWPSSGRASYGYQRSAAHRHQGVDLGARFGSPVWSVFDGVVETNEPPGAEGFNGYGRVLAVRRADGVRAFYAHLDRSLVELGQHVAEGQQLATVGTSRGTVREPALQFDRDGAHLHFETSRRAYPLARERDRIDPLGVETMPPPDAPDAPDTTAAADSLDRWARLDALMVQLHRQVFPRLVNDEQRARADRGLLMWQVAHRGAPNMAPDARVALLDWWINSYNAQRANAIKYGLKNPPPLARRSPNLTEQVDRAVETVKDVAEPFGFGLLVIVGIYLWHQSQPRDRIVVGVQK